MKVLIKLLLVTLMSVLNSCGEKNTPDYPSHGNNRNPDDNSEPAESTIEVPVAQFIYQIQQPLAVAFTNKSTNNPTNTMWDFGDGVTSSELSPKHKYASTGSYIVTLTVSNSAGTSSVRETIKITTPLVYVTGVKYIKVGKENMYYRTVCKDDDFFTTTWWNTTYTSILNSSTIPYSFPFSSSVLMNGLNDDEYYTIYVYWNNKTNGDGTQILKQKMNTYDIKKYPSEIILTSNNADTQVAVMFSYK